MILISDTLYMHNYILHKNSFINLTVITGLEHEITVYLHTYQLFCLPKSATHFKSVLLIEQSRITKKNSEYKNVIQSTL